MTLIKLTILLLIHFTFILATTFAQPKNETTNSTDDTNETTTTPSIPKPSIPDKICEVINEETRKNCLESFRREMMSAIEMVSFGANKKCLLYTDIDFNKLITHDMWPARVPKPITPKPKRFNRKLNG